jgi:hypothetical protein
VVSKACIFKLALRDNVSATARDIGRHDMPQLSWIRKCAWGSIEEVLRVVKDYFVGNVRFVYGVGSKMTFD